jgi:hypothetical protein
MDRHRTGKEVIDDTQSALKPYPSVPNATVLPDDRIFADATGLVNTESLYMRQIFSYSITLVAPVIANHYLPKLLDWADKRIRKHRTNRSE